MDLGGSFKTLWVHANPQIPVSTSMRKLTHFVSVVTFIMMHSAFIHSSSSECLGKAIDNFWKWYIIMDILEPTQINHVSEKFPVPLKISVLSNTNLSLP